MEFRVPMAKIEFKVAENVPGKYFVDSTCINCDACRKFGPRTFGDTGEFAFVKKQPETPQEEIEARRALLSCPVGSIGTLDKVDLKPAMESFPLPLTEEVYLNGYNHRKSYGADSYFIQRAEGNILVDSPRFAGPLVKKLEAMGGVQYMFLTHGDDVADHAVFHKHFGCQRILHTGDVGTGTHDVEVKIKGQEPYSLAPDLLILPVPGHTRGHAVLLYRNTFLFSGDHLAYSERLRQLYAFRDFCWYSWPELVRSMHKLASYSFEWVLPGHGRRFHAAPEQMKIEMQKCLDWLDEQS